MKRRPVPLAFVVCAYVVGLAACGGQAHRGDRPGSALLRHVPADTPYFLATLEPTPRAEMDHYLDQQRKGVEKWRSRQGRREPPFVKVFYDEIVSNLSADGLDRLGVGADFTMALYGIGILPAARMEVKDPPAVARFVERIVAASNGPVAKADPRGKRWEIPIESMTVIVAVTEHELLIGLAESTELAWFVDRLYDVEKTGPTLADTPRVDELIGTYHLLPRFIGWIEFAAAMKAQATPGSLIARQSDSLRRPDQDCVRDIGNFLAAMPRLVFGALEIGIARQRVLAFLELEPTLARELASVRVSAVGVGAPIGASIASFGVSADVPKLLDILAAHARRHLQAPYRCRDLTGMNELASRIDTELAKPIPQWVKDIRGIAVELGDLEGGLLLPKLRGAAVVTAIDPIRLVDVAKRFMPALPAINPPPDGKPVKLQGGVFFVDTYVALKGQLFGVGVGEGADVELVRLMSERPVKDRPMSSFAADPKRLREAMRTLTKKDPPESSFPTAEMQGTIGVTMTPDERGLRFELVHEETH